MDELPSAPRQSGGLRIEFFLSCRKRQVNLRASNKRGTHVKTSHALLAAAISAAGLAGLPALADSDASRTPAPGANRANPDAYDMTATFGTNTVRMVLATTNGKREYTTMLNGKVVASAVAAGANADQMAAYVSETAKVLTGAGADPSQFGVSMLTPVSYSAQPQFDAQKLKKAMGDKVGDGMLSKQLTGSLSD